MTKKHWMQIHTYLSLFFLPAMLIYVITGVGNIFGVDNRPSSVQSFSIPTPQTGKEQEAILKALHEHSMPIPDNTELRDSRNKHVMGNHSYSVEMSTNTNGETIITTVHHSLFDILLTMHKAKNTPFFDVVAIGFSISLILFYVSGLVMTSFCKRNRKEALGTLSAGIFVCCIAIYFSL